MKEGGEGGSEGGSEWLSDCSRFGFLWISLNFQELLCRSIFI